MIHVDKDLALRSQQAAKLAENFNPAGGGKDVSEDIPETCDDVKPGVEPSEVLRRAWSRPVLHSLNRCACIAKLGSSSDKLCNAPSTARCGGRECHRPLRRRAGNGSRRHLGDNQPVDTIQIRPSLLRQAREHWRDQVIGIHGVAKAPGLDLPFWLL